MLWLSLAVAIMAAPAVQPGDGSFDRMKSGAAPEGWQCGVTGTGKAQWVVETDPKAPSPPNVLTQRGEGECPWCVSKAKPLTTGFVETRVKLISGQEDQAGGVIWHWTEGDNYWLARANAAEGNVTLFQVVKGRRRAVKSIELEVTAQKWHLLRAEFTQTHATVFFNGKRVIDSDDSELQGSGLLGVWTKADSVTAFDSFSVGSSL